MRKLYQPHHRGVGDGLAFYFMMGFGAMDDDQKTLVSSELPHVMDDIAALIKVGYTVILDSEATVDKFRDALYSTAPDLSGLRTAGVYWSSDGFEDGAIGTFDGGKVSPSDIVAEKVDRLLRLVVLCASHSSAAAPQWNRSVGAGAFVSTWSGARDANHVVKFLTAGGGHAEGLDNLIERHLLNPPPPVVELEAVLDEDEENAGATMAMVAVPVPATAPAAAKTPDPTTDKPEKTDATGDKKSPDPKATGLDNIANSVFQAFSGGKSLDDVIGEQMSKHKILGGVAATVLPGLVSFAGTAAASKLKHKGAADVIKQASEMTSRVIEDANPDKKDEEEEEAAAEAAAAAEVPTPLLAVPDPEPPAPTLEPAPDSLTRAAVAERIDEAARKLNAEVVPSGDWTRIKVPLSHRSHQVYVAVVGSDELSITLHCNVGHVGPEVDLRGPLRQVAQTSYAKLALSTDDRGDVLVCQGTLPSGALSTDHITQAIDEMAGFADGLEAWIFGGDTN